MPPRDPLEGGRLLVVMPGHVGIAESFSANLRHLGVDHRVATYTECTGRVPYAHFGQRLANLLCKLRGDRGYRQRMMRRLQLERLWEGVGPGEFDHILCIRPDLLPVEDIERLRARAPRIFAYTWDGLGRFGGTLERRHLFEKFHVFDPVDARPGAGMPLLGNFYFDCYPELLPSVDRPPADAYFIGQHDDRWPVIDRLARDLVALGLRPDIQQYIGTSGQFENPPPHVTVLRQQKPYATALAESLRCRILIDIHQPNLHGGLSFRPYEALGYGRKLITSNPLALRQDFHHSANIYCLGHDRRSLTEFLAEPLVPVPEDVRARHGFSAWIRRALDLPAR